MTEKLPPEDVIDATPSPRVLRILGEIDFKAWQCLCEIIDNSIDSFPDVGSRAPDDFHPTVKVRLPANSANSVKPSDYLEISDNGLGMDRETLSKSLKAGFSGNNPVDKMGLFGIGFNIATARLGGRTEVITSTPGSDHFLKVTIDFQELETSGHFLVPVEKIKKKADETQAHGTTIRITKLRIDHIRPLYQRKSVTKKLGKIYGRILLKKDIKLMYHGQRCAPFEHCIWSEQRSGESTSGPVHAVVNIDQLIDEKRYCTTCWLWLSNFDDKCPGCGEADAVRTRERRVKGWIGIQRYFDSAHYGIDLIRNGRVIEELDKSFFYWTNENEDTELEYPVDGHEKKGRIVGEIELDFVKVTHQKDAFERTTADWNEAVLVIRGDGPIRPKIAKSKGYGVNSSPLAQLFSAFRTAKAGIKNLVPQRSNGQAMITDAHLDELAKRFYDGESDYQSDAKWWELVTSANKQKEEHPKKLPVDSDDGGNPFDWEPSDSDEDPSDEGETNGDEVTAVDGEAGIHIEPDLDLSKLYSLDLFKDVTIRVIAERALSKPEKRGFTVTPRGAELYFRYWPSSALFTVNLFTPADLLINELAHQLHINANSELSQVAISEIEIAIREKYFPELYPSVSEIRRMADMICDELMSHMKSNLSTIEEFDIAVLSEVDLAEIKRSLAQNENLSLEQIDQALSDGEFITYAPLTSIIKIVERYPQALFDGVFFSQNWASIQTEKQIALPLKNELISILRDLDWILDNPAATTRPLWRGRAKRLVGGLEILSSWRQ